MKLSLGLCIVVSALVGTSLVPTFVFGQSISAETQQYLDLVRDQLLYRNEVERNSLEYTHSLCEVFRLRKKYDMGLYPDPVSEAWVKMVYFQPGEAWKYTKSLGHWLDVGNEGTLTNWGIKSSPGEEESLIKLQRSLYTRTLVSTEGFKQAAKDCGDLDVKSLRQALFEQERVQTVLTYAAVFGVAVRVVVKGVQAVRLSLVGHALARLPWAGIKRAAIGGLVAYTLFEGTREYFGWSEKTAASLNDELQVVTDRNIQENLKTWLKNFDSKNEAYVNATAYLDKHFGRIAELQKIYKTWLEKVGEMKIDQVVAKFTSGAELTPDEREIFVSAVIFSATNLYLGQR